MHKPAAPFRRQLLLGGLASALTLVAGCSKFARPQGKTLAKEATLLCLGDSLTFGYGAAAGATPRPLPVHQPEIRSTKRSRSTTAATSIRCSRPSPSWSSSATVASSTRSGRNSAPSASKAVKVSAGSKLKAAVK